MRKLRILRRCVVVLSVVLLLTGCGETSDTNHLNHLPEQSVRNRDVQRKRELSRDTVPVQKNGRDFYTLARIPHLERYPCSNCHVDGETVEPEQRPGNRRAHWDLKLTHGNAKDMTCRSCHNTRNMDTLRSVTGETVSYNRPDRLCGDCHFEQRKDWVGGAHGKQVKAWAKPRVIYNCTTCHNPHDPDYEKRWPVTYPSIPRTVNDRGS